MIQEGRINESNYKKVLAPSVLNIYKEDTGAMRVYWDKYVQWLMSNKERFLMKGVESLFTNTHLDYGHTNSLEVIIKSIIKSDDIPSQYSFALSSAGKQFMNTFIFFINTDGSISMSLPIGIDLILRDLLLDYDYNGGIFLEHTYADILNKSNEEVYFVFDSPNVKLADGTNFTYKSYVDDVTYSEGGLF